ncbi:hypothetical protein EDD15DRAFT_2363126 [Pisolithus albus]|nr:hypothetical protein EDD15DRAFT_2363126 [Pisolithus albus]
MEYSRQYIAENGIGAILVFEYLYFLLQVKDGRNDLQEDLNFAVDEYKSSGIQAKVNKLIQEAFQSYGDNVEILCPILVKIAQQNQLYQTIDARYWEHKAEISCSAKLPADKLSTAKPSDNKNSSSSTPHSDAKGKSKPKDGQKPDAAKSDIAHLLSKDGKLNSAEHQHHLKNNLCLFCGEGGHSTKDCPKSTSHTAKAHATVAETPPAPPSEKAEAKN